VDATHYTLVVTPAANTTGTITVSVAAGKFKDIANNANTAAASASQAFDTTQPAPVVTDTVLLSFDEATAAFTGMGAYGGALPDVVAGPTGGSGKALKIVKPAGPDAWGGTYFGTATPIAFTASRKTISARVYASRAGAVIKFKVESSNGGPAVEVASSPTGAANTWQTLTWDLSAVDASKSYGTIAITPDADRVTDGQIYYFDDISLVGAVADTAPPTVSISDNVSAATAAGAVAFSFTFSEDVGTSFDATDITVAGGSAGALAKVDATHYTLVVTPAANTTGTITVSVAAGKFKDIANNANTAAATASQAFDTTTVAGPTNYLAVANNAISLVDRGVTSNFSMTQFQNSPGISVKWPMSSPAVLNVTLAEVGSFTLAPNQKLSAAVQILETTANGKGEVRAYIENVGISKSGSAITIAVPSPATAKVYGVSSDGQKKAVIDFATGVASVANTLTSNGLNSILLGDVVNYAINKVSNDFTDITGLRGTYKVSIVITDLPLRKTDGSLFTPLVISVPTTLDSSGSVTVSTPVTGWGLEGYITLTD
jgi:hypothetical protein